MLTADNTRNSAPSGKGRTRFGEFFATLDLAAELGETTKQEKSKIFLGRVFGTQDALQNAIREFSSLHGQFHEKKELVSFVERLLKEDARNFLILAHLFRQIRFTNIELINMLFDGSNLSNFHYLTQLTHNDPEFASANRRAMSSKSWQGHLLAVDEVIVRLATFKRTIGRYLGSEEKCWPLWRSRIERDAQVRAAIANFAVNNEDLAQIVEDKAVEPILKRSLRTVNVEMVKKERGGFAPRRVSEILSSNGFERHDYGTHDIQVLEEKLAIEGSERPNLGFTAEVSWKPESKVFDFVLVGETKIGFVLEVNYFSTSMSKIREVVRHFKELKKACGTKYRLIYVTDGVGWLNLGKSVLDMLMMEEDDAHGQDQIPFLMNLRIFEDNISRIKSAIQVK